MREGFSSRPYSLGVLSDYVEEHWPSMDLVAAQVIAQAGQQADRWQVHDLRPAFRRQFSSAGSATGRGFTADRLLNRLWHYPRHVSLKAVQHDVLHLADHSYSQLLHHLPAQRALVSLHDLDTFTCVLSPESEPRGVLFRQMTQRIWSGLLKAGHVACDSHVVRTQLLAAVPSLEARSSVIYNGVAPVFFEPPGDVALQAVNARLGARAGGAVEILHVGSNIPRKRIDLLLRIFAAVRAAGVPARLLRVGARMTEPQRALAASLGILGEVVEHTDVPLNELIAIYARADLVLLTPDREGFGLPMIEALATGTPVVARDIPILREVGGNHPSYFAGEEVLAGRDAVLATLRAGHQPEAIAQRKQWARRFSWSVAGQAWMQCYESLLRQTQH